MSPPPDGVTAQSRWPCGTAIRTYSLYCFICISGWPQRQRPFQGLVEVSQHTVKHSLGLMLHEQFLSLMINMSFIYFLFFLCNCTRMLNKTCYLPKFTFWQVCSFVGLSVCLSVCLSVSLSVLSSITHERFDISSPNLVHIWNGSAVPVCDIDK